MTDSDTSPQPQVAMTPIFDAVVLGMAKVTLYQHPQHPDHLQLAVQRFGLLGEPDRLAWIDLSPAQSRDLAGTIANALAPKGEQ